MFAGRKFALVNKSEPVQQLIEENGGTIVTWKERYSRETTPQLVIVSDSIDFEYYDQLNAIMVPTVTPAWVHECAKSEKVVPTRPFSPDPHHFMRSVNMCTTGLSAGDAEVFSAGVKAAGGEYSSVLTIYTTHLVATDLGEEICRLAAESGQIKIVTPEWFDDCMKLGRKVDEGPYYLESDKQDTGASLYLVGTYEAEDDTVTRHAIESSVRKGLGSEVFLGKRFYISADLNISPRMKKHIYYLVEANGGEVVDEFDAANVYLFKYRAGPEYVKASKKTKCPVGNLLWLYWMAIQQKWELPHKHLLHYPEVEGGLPDMRDKIISITNYSGEARNYLRTLIESIGARYTGTLCQQSNTHLIAAYSEGPKYSAAQNWGIKIVNHLWLEDSYSKWMLQDENVPRYQYLPKRLDLTTLIGSTPLSTSVLRQFYTNKAPVVERHLPSRAARNKAQQDVHQAVLKENLFKMTQNGSIENDQDPRRALERRSEPEPDVPEPHSREAEPEAEPEAVPSPGPSPASSPAPEPDLNPKKLEHIQPVPEQEQEPEQSSSRPIESSPTTSGPTDAPADAEANASATPSKRKSRESPEPVVVEKRPKHETLRVMITRVDNALRSLPLDTVNIKLVKWGPVHVLVAPSIVQSERMLTAMAEADDIVGPQWLEDCAAKQERLDTEPYRLEGALSLLQNRAKLDGVGLLEGLRFRISPKIKDKRDLLEVIIEAHGGRLIKRKGKNIFYVRDSDEGDDSPYVPDTIINAIGSMDLEFREKLLGLLT